MVNACLKLDLPKVWGEGPSVSADGTEYEIYIDSLIAEYHIRYGGYGVIAHRHVADSCIALFTHFFPCLSRGFGAAPPPRWAAGP